MVVKIKEDSRIAEFWLTNAEQLDELLMADVRRQCAEYKAKKYQPVMFLSGKGDLLENTTSLLIHQLRKGK